MREFHGQVAAITGGASGIGREICLHLARGGATIAVLDLQVEHALETVRMIESAGGRARAFLINVSDPASVSGAFAEILQWGGKVDILVNCAGITAVSKVEDTAPDDFRRVFDVNVDGTFLTCKAVVPGMRERGAGKIVNIASWYGKQGKPQYAAYSASKAAVIGFTQSLAMEVARDGINVNAVCPGLIVETAMREAADKLSREQNLTTAAERAHAVPLGRVGKPKDIAPVVAFLASSDADYMVGQSINVTGGLIMH
jgi:NAD(P)-dependent dehydrogenase (short-subunit alcohol dehydrogenase family)